MPPVRCKKSNAAANSNRNRAHKARGSKKTEGRRDRTLDAVRKEPNETAMASRIPEEVLNLTRSVEPYQIINAGRQISLLLSLEKLP